MGDSSSTWKEIIGGTAMGALITTLGQLYREHRKKNTTASQGVLDASAIYSAMNNCKQHSDYKSIILYTAHNSGERILACRHQFISAMFEVYAEPFDSAIEKMQNWRIDSSTNEILSEMIIKGRATSITDNMGEGRMKDIYIDCGVKTSEIFMIGETSTKLFYISFMSHKNDASAIPRNRSHMELCLDTVMATIRKSIKKL